MVSIRPFGGIIYPTVLGAYRCLRELLAWAESGADDSLSHPALSSSAAWGSLPEHDL